MSTPAKPPASDSVPGLTGSITGEILVLAIVVVFFMFIFFLVLFLRANRYFGALPLLERSSRTLPESGTASLDSAVFKSLPVIIFSSTDFKDGMECSVCLSELFDGEPARVLPGCHHVFHLECIDAWFGSNSTCPVCRCSVDPKNASSVDDRALRPARLVSVDGSGEGSSSSDGSCSRKNREITAIQIPKNEAESSDFALQFRRFTTGEEGKLPALSSLGSLRRILSMGSGLSSRGWDVEQGAATITLDEVADPTSAAAAAMEEMNEPNRNVQS